MGFDYMFISEVIGEADYVNARIFGKFSKPIHMSREREVLNRFKKIV